MHRACESGFIWICYYPRPCTQAVTRGATGGKRRRRAASTASSWRTRVQTSSTLSADATTFYLTNVLEAYEGHVRVFARTWTAGIPRDFA